MSRPNRGGSQPDWVRLLIEPVAVLERSSSRITGERAIETGEQPTPT
jgi:hypothetical protein